MSKLVVIGNFRSGTSYTVGKLQEFGVDFGTKFFKDYSEHLRLTKYLSKSFNFRTGGFIGEQEELERQIRIAFEEVDGLKHPLLSLCLPTIRKIQPDVKVIVCLRPLEQVVKSLNEKGWYKFNTRRIQTRIRAELVKGWDYLADFEELVSNPKKYDKELEQFASRNL